MTDFNTDGGRGFEEAEASAKGIFAVAIGLIIAALVMGILVTTYFNELKNHFVKRGGGTDTAVKFSVPTASLPGPRLQVDEASDLHTYLERENKILSSYGWADKEKSIAHVPIERAIEILTSPDRGVP